MGGRTSYPVKKVLGDLRQTAPELKALAVAIEKENTEKIVSSTVNAFRKSDYALSNLAHLIIMSGLFTQLEGKTIKGDIRKIVTKYWIKAKRDKGFTTTPEADRNIINSATRALKHRDEK